MQVLSFAVINKYFLLFYAKEGTTPLMLAAANNHVTCVRELLEQGADVNAQRNVRYYYLTLT